MKVILTKFHFSSYTLKYQKAFFSYHQFRICILDPTSLLLALINLYKLWEKKPHGKGDIETAG